MLRKDTTEKYLKVIYDLTQRNKVVRACDIAEKMRFSRPTVCVMLRKLEEEGYIEYAGERVVVLTDLGCVIAERSAVRIRFFKSLLLQLGTPPKIAEQEAEQLSTVLSTESYERIYAYVTAHNVENKA